MSFQSCPPCPGTLKIIQHYLKTASEFDGRDIVISYWCGQYALREGYWTDKSSPESKKLINFLMDWLENVKSEHGENEAITQDAAAKVYLEDYAMKLFLWADSKDRAADFDENVWKTFYISGNLFDVLQIFGEPFEVLEQNRKYAQRKAVYIYNCLKNGETPVPGPMGGNELDSDFSNYLTSSDLSNIGFQEPVVPDVPEAPKPASSVVNPPDPVVPVTVAVVPTVPEAPDNDSGKAFSVSNRKRKHTSKFRKDDKEKKKRS